MKSTKIKLPLTDVLLVYVDTLPFGHFTFFKQFEFARHDWDFRWLLWGTLFRLMILNLTHAQHTPGMTEGISDLGIGDWRV